MAITASMVKELRELTGVGMLDCKKALAETDGDMEKAVEYLSLIHIQMCIRDRYVPCRRYTLFNLGGAFRFFFTVKVVICNVGSIGVYVYTIQKRSRYTFSVCGYFACRTMTSAIAQVTAWTWVHCGCQHEF